MIQLIVSFVPIFNWCYLTLQGFPVLQDVVSIKLYLIFDLAWILSVLLISVYRFTLYYDLLTATGHTANRMFRTIAEAGD